MTGTKTGIILRYIYQILLHLYRKQVNYQEAIRYTLLFENLKDSLFNQGLSTRIFTMQYDFQLDQKEREIKFLGQQQELQQKKLELQQGQIRQQRFIVVGLIIFISICLWAYIVF